MTASNGAAMGLVTTANSTMGRLKMSNKDTTMGMPKCDEDYDNDEDGVKDEDFAQEIFKD